MKIEINPNLCKGCKICIDVCIKGVYDISIKTNPKGVYIPFPSHIELCNDCEMCMLSCPDQAITVINDEK